MLGRGCTKAATKCTHGEVLWGSEEDEKYSANNILSKEDDFSNSTHANYWLAKKGELKGQGFILRVGNSKQKILHCSRKRSTPFTQQPRTGKKLRPSAKVMMVILHLLHLKHLTRT